MVILNALKWKLNKAYTRVLAMKFGGSVVIFLLAALLPACGGDGGGDDAAPSISNLRYTPTSELQLPVTAPRSPAPWIPPTAVAT